MKANNLFMSIWIPWVCCEIKPTGPPSGGGLWLEQNSMRLVLNTVSSLTAQRDTCHWLSAVWRARLGLKEHVLHKRCTRREACSVPTICTMNVLPWTAAVKNVSIVEKSTENVIWRWYTTESVWILKALDRSDWPWQHVEAKMSLGNLYRKQCYPKNKNKNK